MFLSCKVHPPTADVTPGGAAALFLGKNSIFICLVRGYSGFWGSQGVRFAMEQDLFAGKSSGKDNWNSGLDEGQQRECVSPKFSSFPTKFRGFREHREREQMTIAPKQLLLPGLGKADFGRLETNPTLFRVVILSRTMEILQIPNTSMTSGGVGGWWRFWLFSWHSAGLFKDCLFLCVERET